MDNNSLVEQIVRSLSFEVEAIPQDNIIQVSTTSKSAPLNVKIRVRKKDEAGLKNGILSLPKPGQANTPERIRLVSSDQTIMSFNMVMEADFEKPKRKPRKNILGIFTPTICLGAQPDDDNYAYLPTTTYKADIDEQNSSKSDGAIMKLNLKRETDVESATLPKRKKDIFGKCKPGGCLDPPFGEDKQPYSPAIINLKSTTTEQGSNVTDPIDEQTDKARKSSIISKNLFNWKRKSKDNEALETNVIKNETRAEPVLDLYQAGSLQTSATYSNSILTYPPTLNSSDLRIRERKQPGSRINSDSSNKSFSVHSDNYFITPKMIKNVLDVNNINKTEDKDDIDFEKNDTKYTQSNNKNTETAQNQNLEQNDKTPILRTKSSVTDVRVAEEFLLESADSKTNEAKKASDFREDSKHQEENRRISKQTPFRTSHDNFVPPIIPIPLLTKTELMHHDNISNKDNEEDNKTEVLTTPALPLPRKNISEIPAEAEKILLRAGENSDNFIEDQNKIMNLYFITDKRENNNNEKEKAIDHKIDDGIENVWTPHNMKNSSNLESSESTESEDYDDPNLNKVTLSKSKNENRENFTDNREPQKQIITLGHKEPTPLISSIIATDMNKSSSGNHIYLDTVNIIESKTKPDDMMISDNITVNNEQKLILTEEPVNILKRTRSNEYSSETNKGIKNIQSSQSSETKIEDKSVVTLDTKHQKSVYDLTVKAIGDDLLENQIIPVKKDNSLKMTDVKDDDLKQIWKNKIDPLESNIKFHTIDEDKKTNDTVMKNAIGETIGERLSFSLNADNNNDQKSKMKSLDEETINILNENAADIKNIQSENSVTRNVDSEVFNNFHLEDDLLRLENNILGQADKHDSERSFISRNKTSTLETAEPSKRSDENSILRNNISTLDITEPNKTKGFIDIMQTESNSRTKRSDENSILRNNISTLDIAEPNKTNGFIDVMQTEHNSRHTSGDTQIKTSPLNVVSDDVTSKSISPTYEQNEILTSDLHKHDSHIDGYNKHEAYEEFHENASQNSHEKNEDHYINSNMENNNDNYKLHLDKTNDDIKPIDQFRVQNEDNIEHITYNSETKTDEGNTFILSSLPDKTGDSLNSQKKLKFDLDSKDELKVNYHEPESTLYSTDHKEIYPDSENDSESKTAQTKLYFNSANSLEPKVDQTKIYLHTDLKSKTDQTESNLDSVVYLKTKTVTTKMYPDNEGDLKSETDQSKFYVGSTDDLEPKTYQSKIYTNIGDDLKSKADQTIYSNLDSKAELISTKALSMNAKPFSEDLNLKHPEAFEVKSNKISPFKISLGIQSYLGEHNEVIVKSFDADNVPKRYSNDTVRITKHDLQINDRLKIPIGPENNLYVEIKSNNQIDEEFGNDLNTEIARARFDNTYKTEMDLAKRNVIIADGIQKTLMAVYEDELLPLRNTISELKHHIEMLNSQHMLLKGHVFIRKPRPVRLVPLRKCGCGIRR